MAFLAADEFRLLYAVLLNALVLWASWRLARRFNDDRLAAAGDAGLLFYLVQYASVCGTGILGGLHPLTIGLVAILASSAMAAMGGRWGSKQQVSTIPLSRLERAVVTGAVLFVAGYIATLVWHQRQLPVISNDALTYHLPAAVEWLQKGRLALYEAWFYNPANSYSPLAGSVFLAWLMAPMGNDVLARFVQVGPAVLFLIAMMHLCRSLGARVGAAALIAAACVVARPFMSQTILAKDDLFVAAFFVLLIDAMRRPRLEAPFGPWRVGVALGLLLATKFTVLFSVPIVLLMLGRGWTWRRAAIAAVVTLVLAGPWYLRNLSLTGNPLYPTSVKVLGVTLLPGMLDVGRSDLLKSARGIWAVFTAGYYAMPPAIALLLIAGWAAALGVVWRGGHRDLWRDRLFRTVLIGPVIGIGLFVVAAPYGEMRFAYPAVALLFGGVALALARAPAPVQMALSAALLILSAMTAFRLEMARDFTAVAAVAAATGMAFSVVRAPRAVLALAGVGAAVFVGMLFYVYWSAYVDQVEEGSTLAWGYEKPNAYGSDADVWRYVREEVPAGATIAYANTYFTYPLMGFEYDHRVVYAPTRRGLERFIDMPRIEGRMTGEQIPGRIVDMLREDPDQAEWLRRLRETGATHLVVMKYDPARPDRTIAAPEAIFAAQEPQRFVPVFDNDAGTVYQVNW